MNRKLLKGWNLMRVIRLGLGLFIIAQGVHTHDRTFAALGVLFTLMPLLNIGCCGTNGCSVPASKNEHKHTEDIVYEEVH